MTGTSDVLMMKVQRSDSHRPTNAEGSGLRPSRLFEEAMEVTVIASLSLALSQGSDTADFAPASAVGNPFRWPQDYRKQ